MRLLLILALLAGLLGCTTIKQGDVVYKSFHPLRTRSIEIRKTPDGMVWVTYGDDTRTPETVQDVVGAAVRAAVEGAK